MAKFFHTPKPKGFHVEPRYWDPIKEERENRERRIKAELGIKDEEGSTYRPYISKGAFKQGMSKGKWHASRERKKTNTRLLIIVLLLLAILYFMMKI